MQYERVVGTIFLVLLGHAASAQDAATIDFARDVQPILQQHCVSCHGPSQQMSGLRLDRRRDAMRGGTIGTVIAPGNPERSRLLARISGTAMGPQMPPSGAMEPEQIAVLARWIQQGADWPDALSGDGPVVPPHPGATRLMDLLRAGDTSAFTKALAADAEAAQGEGTGGVTPLMYAALYGDAGAMRLLLDRGADVNIRNDAGATALMWAARDLEKARLLLDRGADVNARSLDGRTPLMIAAARFGSSPVLRLMLERGAKPNHRAPSLIGPASPLSEAAYAGDAEAMKVLIAHGADPKLAGFVPLTTAIQSGCDACLDLLLPSAEPAMLTAALAMAAPPLGDATRIQKLLERGADANARGPFGRIPVLLAAAASDAVTTDAIRMLLARGADPHATGAAGETPATLAARNGRTPVVDLLLGTAEMAPAPSREMVFAPVASHPPSPRDAVARSLPVIQRTGGTFLDKSGCVSCHNNTLAAMTVSAARGSGIAVDEEAARGQTSRIGAFLESWRERALQGVGIPGDADTVSYILHGLAAERYAPDAATDAMAYFLRNRQLADGRWAILAHRPPIESSDIEVTATSIRALRVYAPAVHRAEYEESIRRASVWLATAPVRTNEDRTFRLLGLTWAGANKEAIAAAARDVLAAQQPVGGWSQLSSLSPDAYATGQALVALYESGAMQPSEPAFRRGAQFLLQTQLADGTWHVKTRSIALQPPLEIGFPHGPDAWISAAATNWAATALAYAARTPQAPLTRQRTAPQ